MKRHEYLALIAVILVTLYVAHSDRDAAPRETAVRTHTSEAGTSDVDRPFPGAPLSVEDSGVLDRLPSPATGMRPALVGVRAAAVTPARLPDTSTLIAGTASWFCGGSSRCTRNFPAGGPYAAAGSELRIPGWRGKWVQVCSGGRCTRARLIDWCLCGGARVIDLYRSVFGQLAAPSRGVIPVTVTFVDLPKIRLPRTDTGGTP